MANYFTCRSSSDFTTARQHGGAIPLRWILILFISPIFAQSEDCVYQFITLERPAHLKAFLNTEVLNQKESFRIIHFGDSHIQGDRITGEIRTQLREIQPIVSSGIIFPYSLCGSVGPRGTQNKVTGSFTYASQLKNPTGKPIGLMGYELSLKKNASLSLQFTENFTGVKSKTISLWVQSDSDTTHLAMDSTFSLVQRLKINDNVYWYTFESLMVPSVISFKALVPLSFWGMEFELKNGIIYQQSGVVGAQFTHLIQHQTSVIAQLKSLKPDLLFFSYGTNEAYSSQDSNAYEQQVVAFLSALRTSLPSTGIVVFNAPDTRSNGRTPKNQTPINHALQRSASRVEVSFFDLHASMGGWGSLYDWNKKGRVLNDLLHFNQAGASLLGKLMAQGMFDACALDERINQKLKESIIKELCIQPKPEINSLDSLPPPEPNNVKPKPTPPKPKTRVYIVKSGDSLYKIAAKTGRTVQQLKTMNRIGSNNIIRPGQKIYY